MNCRNNLWYVTRKYTHPLFSNAGSLIVNARKYTHQLFRDADALLVNARKMSFSIV